MAKKTKYIFLFIVVVSGLYFAEKWVDRQKEAYPTITHESTPNTFEEFSKDFLPTSTTGVIVQHAYFTLSYSESHEQAEWVAYELSKKQLYRRSKSGNGLCRLAEL